MMNRFLQQMSKKCDATEPLLSRLSEDTMKLPIWGRAMKQRYECTGIDHRTLHFDKLCIYTYDSINRTYLRARRLNKHTANVNVSADGSGPDPSAILNNGEIGIGAVTKVHRHLWNRVETTSNFI